MHAAHKHSVSGNQWAITLMLLDKIYRMDLARWLYVIVSTMFAIPQIILKLVPVFLFRVRERIY